MILFVHIPRTGGQCFQQLFLQNYRRPRVLFVRGNQTPEPDAVTDYDACGGHVPWGALGNPVTHITLLREPVARHRSEYFFNARHPNAHRHEAIENGLTLRDWFDPEIGNQFRALNNMTTRYLSGAHLRRAPDRPLAVRSIENLCTMPAFGLTERFDESMLMIGRAMQWQHIFVVQTNAKTRDDDETIEVDAAHPLFKFDRDIYKFAAELFDDRVAREGPLFREALAAYREIVAVLRAEFAHYSTVTVGPKQPKDALRRLRQIMLPEPIRAALPRERALGDHMEVLQLL